MTIHPNPKIMTVKNKKYLEWLTTQPCVNCGRYPIPEVLQITYAHDTGGGMGKKEDDTTALPLCVAPCHIPDEHNGFETFWGLIKYRGGMSRDDFVRAHQERYQRENH